MRSAGRRRRRRRVWHRGRRRCQSPARRRCRVEQRIDPRRQPVYPQMRDPGDLCDRHGALRPEYRAVGAAHLHRIAPAVRATNSAAPRVVCSVRYRAPFWPETSERGSSRRSGGFVAIMTTRKLLSSRFMLPAHGGPELAAGFDHGGMCGRISPKAPRRRRGSAKKAGLGGSA
jgi:hypothetical protein